MATRLRVMTEDDLPLGMRLSVQAGWNQTEADWRRFHVLSGGGSFVAERDEVAVGTVVTFLFGSVGWVAVLLVEETSRGQGIGTELLNHAVDYLKSHHVETVRLDATALGKPIYERIGFQVEYELVRLEGVIDLDCDAPGGPTGERSFEAVCRLDRNVTGTDRRRLLELMANERRVTWDTLSMDGELRGACLTRPGRRASYLGPAIVTDSAVGPRVLELAARPLHGHEAFMDIPCPNRAATDWAQTVGLTPQRVLTRMALGEPVVDRPELLWASSGPEKG